MGGPKLRRGDRFGLLRPASDAHTLGPRGFADQLSRWGLECELAPEEVSVAAAAMDLGANAKTIVEWVRNRGFDALGFSYRLDPEDGVANFGRLVALLRRAGLFGAVDSPVRALYFAGLPRTCEGVRAAGLPAAACFSGGEDRATVLEILGLPMPEGLEVEETSAYDRGRFIFARDLVHSARHLEVKPVDRSRYRSYGLRGDSILARVADATLRGLPPVLRAHVGPFLPDREEAFSLFLEWVKTLGAGGLLDVLSIGNSQLSQSEFGRDWSGLPDGGGVPIATPEEFSQVWKAARPMLVRSYSGTRNVPGMARILEERIDNAWYALSLWWFSELDGRGPNRVLENLRQHLETLRYAGQVGKPFEPNVPHHFAFRGGDDLTYIVSGLLAAKAAKAQGIRLLILQVMLNTPRATSGLSDLAKARALVHLVRELEDGDFKVLLQTRGGLDYFSSDPWEARVQLAASTALMDDIEPFDAASPQIIHVVSFSEGSDLATPSVIQESLQLTHHALVEYRRQRASGQVYDIGEDPSLLVRTAELIREARLMVAAIEARIPAPYSAEGLYAILASGYLQAPGLVGGREEFAAACRWPSAIVGGAVRLLDDSGGILGLPERLAYSAEASLGLTRLGRGLG